MMDRHKPLGSFVAKWGVRSIAHSIGVVAVAALLWLPFLNEFTFQTILESFHYFNFIQLTWVGVALHLALAACLWALMVILFEIIFGRRSPAHKTLRVQRGSVMTETLIVMPIFLLLTFGIAQLAMNNIAGVVANAAVFQAGRTAWLWSAEAAGGRSGVTSSMAGELAHVQAAAVLTPVAPGEFMQNTSGGSTQFEQMRGILIGSQIPSFSNDSGQTGMNAADALIAGANLSRQSGVDSSFFRAFDTSSWPQRTARKFTFAYHATEVTVLPGGDQVGVRLTYYHNQAFPLVGRIFGEFHNVGNRPGYYAVITREFTMPTQIPPNPNTP